MIDLVEQIEARFRDLEAELSDPAVIGDRERFTATSSRPPSWRPNTSAPPTMPPGLASCWRTGTTPSCGRC